MASSSWFSRTLLALLLAAASAAAAPKTTVLFLGDSLTSGLGVDDSQAYPALLEKRWKTAGLPWKARVFAFIGGETSDIRDSLDFTLADGDVALVVVMIGGNDGLLMLKPPKVRKNLDSILSYLKGKGVPVLLVAMKADAARDAKYAAQYDPIYPELAEKFHIPLAPCPLDGIYRNPKLTVDRIHPNVEGQRLLAERLAPHLRKALPKAP